MFGSLGVPELILIMVVALIVFGPRKLPEIGRTLGKALGEFRKATDDLKNTIEREVRMEELKKIGPDLITPVESVSRIEPVAAPDGTPAAAESEIAEAAVPREMPYAAPVTQEAPADPIATPHPARVE
ncbi:MAG TPA: twin-arginine translocase TatA/TatE family subunit [Thermoanaerobaculia bacterium]|jgi:TatA/E family protein of Tat protein translocase